MNINKKAGFTLVEAVVGSAVFLIISVATFGAFVSLLKLAEANQSRLLAVHLMNEQFEIIRNMPYSDIGIQNGVPAGSIPATQTMTRGGIDFILKTTVRNIDLEFDGKIDDPSNLDTAPADAKGVSVEVECPSCDNWKPMYVNGQISPKSLETSSSNGALFVQVFDSGGRPIEGASVQVKDVTGSTTIDFTDTTNINGLVQIIDIPPGGNAYQVKVWKVGYSSDQTYTIGDPANPVPSKPDVSVLVQQVSQISFAIDRVSHLNVASVNSSCTAIPDFDFKISGAKTIGENVYKYSETVKTDATGILNIDDLEWDTYKITPLDTINDIIGTNPLNPITLNPGNIQNFQITLAGKAGNSILIKTIDNATLLPLSESTVTLTHGVDTETKLTGRGFKTQTDWSNGSGFVYASDDFSGYFVDDGNVDVNTVTGEIKLKSAFGSYNPSGILESSTFNIGSSSNFYTLSWLPSDQPAAVGSNSVQFQLATNVEITPTTTWTFMGPDGTDQTYYTNSQSSISSVHTGGAYVRYRAYLSTASSTYTPTVSDVSFTYTNNCLPPGQVLFTGLDAGTYTVTVQKSGYADWTGEIEVVSGWQEESILMGP